MRPYCPKMICIEPLQKNNGLKQGDPTLILSDWDNYDIEIPEGVRKELERVDFELEPFFSDATVDVYINTPFFLHLCHREAWAIESGFIALPQELCAIAFHHAVLINRADIFKAVVCASNRLKADVNNDFLTDIDKIPPLMTACQHHCRRSFLALIKNGDADLSVCDEDGYSLARACIESHDLSFMQMARKNGVVFDVTDPVDALIPLAAWYGFYPVVRWLIDDLGGDVNATDEGGRTALDWACLHENRNLFLYLLDKGGKMTDGHESLFGFIIDQIKELQKQPLSEMIERRMDHQIETLRFLKSKA